MAVNLGAVVIRVISNNNKSQGSLVFFVRSFIIKTKFSYQTLRHRRYKQMKTKVPSKENLMQVFIVF